MANNVKKQSRPRWTNSEVQSLQLWHSQGVSLEEIARRLGRTYASVAGALSNRRGTMDTIPQLRRGRNIPTPSVNVAVEERRKQQQCIYQDVSQTNHIVVQKSIIQVGQANFQARLLMTKHDLTGYRGITMAEFTTIEACHRWFLAEQEAWRYDS